MTWKLTDLAQDEIAALEADGVKVTPQDVLTIQALSLEAIGRFEDGIKPKGKPVICGNVTLWPLTIAAAIWQSETNELLKESDWDSKLFVLAYAMANGHNAEALVEGKAALQAVKQWAKKITCSTADLIEAINDVLGDRPRVSLTKKKADDEEEQAAKVPLYLLETATAIFGNAETAEYQMSMEYVANIIHRHFVLSATANGGKVIDSKTTDGLRKLAMFVDELRAKQNG